jgi:hypothetical protein
MPCPDDKEDFCSVPRVQTNKWGRRKENTPRHMRIAGYGLQAVWNSCCCAAKRNSTTNSLARRVTGGLSSPSTDRALRLCMLNKNNVLPLHYLRSQPCSPMVTRSSPNYSTEAPMAALLTLRGREDRSLHSTREPRDSFPRGRP